MTQEEMWMRSMELKLNRMLELLEDNSNSKVNEDRIEKISSEWITLTQACELHGAYKLTTLRARADLQPKCGVATMIGRNKCWRKEEILEWLNAASPDQRKAYQAKYRQEAAG